MEDEDVLCSSPHCKKLLSNNPDGSPPYSIIKCGHIYHGSCFENVKRFKFCPKCHVVFHPRQSCKIDVSSPQTNPEENAANEVKQNEFYQWMFYDAITKVTAAEFEEFACPMGTNESGLQVYVARAFYKEEIVPAFIVPQTKRVFTIFENEVLILTEDIEILDIHNDKAQALYEWVECDGGALPNKAMVTGKTSSGNILYTVRSKHLQNMAYGKLDASMAEAQVICALEEDHGTYSYKVEKRNKYEVLVRKPLTKHANL